MTTCYDIILPFLKKSCISNLFDPFWLLFCLFYWFIFIKIRSNSILVINFGLVPIFLLDHIFTHFFYLKLFYFCTVYRCIYIKILILISTLILLVWIYFSLIQFSNESLLGLWICHYHFFWTLINWLCTHFYLSCFLIWSFTMNIWYL